MNKILPVILAGGTGTRLWPISDDKLPKQFIEFDFLNESKTGCHSSKKSLFTATLERVYGDLFLPPVIVTSASFQKVAEEQTQSFIKSYSQNTRQQKDKNYRPKILLEPDTKSTLLAIINACLYSDILYSDDVNILVLPSDHIIKDKAAFMRDMQEALSFKNNNNLDNFLFTFGVKATKKDSNFGYLNIKEGKDNIYRLRDFYEKPSLDRFKDIDLNECLVNCGIFLFNKDYMLNILVREYPKLTTESKKFWNIKSKNLVAIRRKDNSPSADDAIELSQDIYKSSETPTISFDHAIMENLKIGYSLKANFDWLDIGSFGNFRKTVRNFTSQTTPNGEPSNQKPLFSDDENYKEIKNLTNHQLDIIIKNGVIFIKNLE